MPLDGSPGHSALVAAVGRVFTARNLHREWASLALHGEAAALGCAFQMAEQGGFLDEMAFAMLETGVLPEAGRAAVRERLVELVRDALDEGSAGTMQAILEDGALSDATTMLPALLKAGRACARIRIQGSNGMTEAGTGFLVGDDLVLTAGHVVVSLVTADGREAGEGDRIEVTFPNPLDTPARLWPSGPLFAAREGWLAYWSPPAGTYPDFDPDVGDRLDCALVRLAAPVTESVPRLDVLDPPSAVEGRRLHVLGHLQGGGKLCFDHGPIRGLDRSDTRVRHLAAAVRGMSGGPCLDESGRLLAVHEGSAKTPQPDHNRGVALRSVREAMRRMADPLDAAGRAWFIRSGEEVEEWSRLAGLPCDGRDPRHPVFGREALRGWIAAGRTGAQPVFLVSGGPGSGKTFTVRLLRAWLPHATDAVVALPPEVVRTGDPGAIIARCDEALGISPSEPPISYRAPAGELRLDLLNPALDRWGKRTAAGPLRRLWVAADLGGPDSWAVDTVRGLWTELLRLAIPRRGWLRLAVLGIEKNVASALWNNVGLSKTDVLRESLDDFDWDKDVWPIAKRALDLTGQPSDDAAYGARNNEWLALLARPGARTPVESVRLVRGIL